MTAAFGIVEIANAAMASALRLMSVQRGLDPRGFGLVGFGGAGPVHVNRLAAEMGIVRTIVPPSPGTFSALGLLMNDLRHEYSQTFLRRTASADVAAIAIDVRAPRGGRPGDASSRGSGRRRRRRRAACGDAVRRPELRVADRAAARRSSAGRPRGRRTRLPRGARAGVRLRGACRADRDRQPAPRDDRADPRVGAEHHRPRSARGAAEGRSRRLFRRGGRLRPDADLRALPLPRGNRPDRPGHRRGDGLDDGHPSRLFGPIPTAGGTW